MKSRIIILFISFVCGDADIFGEGGEVGFERIVTKSSERYQSEVEQVKQQKEIRQLHVERDHQRSVGNYERARKASERLYELEPDKPEHLVDAADAAKQAAMKKNKKSEKIKLHDIELKYRQDAFHHDNDDNINIVALNTRIKELHSQLGQLKFDHANSVAKNAGDVAHRLDTNKSKNIISDREKLQFLHDEADRLRTEGALHYKSVSK